jgi:DNA topoisomerase-3
MQLVVAEKPSVARDLARVLGVRAAGEHCFEGERHVITWCIGHLVELEDPAAYDARWRAWRLDTLPMLPAEFRLRPAASYAGARAQLRAVTRLLGERRFRSVVNACDAGREGELIFRYVYQYARARLPIERLWVSSLTDDAIRRGFAALRSGRQLEPLADAARSRSEADWLVGMNATRAITVHGRTGGHDVLYSIGRVQTPTLAMLVARERAIREFVPVPYWEVRAELRTAGGARFPATWRAPAGSRLATQVLADTLVARDRAHGAASDPLGPVVERVRSRTVREPPPLLFDLTSLQRTANRRFQFSAARTLELAQALYERHKILTYPRTDSRHLSSDLASELPQLFAALAASPEHGPFAARLVASPPVPSRRIVDDSKVSDHHAIIPTGRLAGTLDRDEQRIYDLVVRRFLGAFYPDAEFAATEAWIRVGPGDTPAPKFPDETRPASTSEAREPPILDTLPAPPDRYLARGRVRVVAGWQEVAGIEDRSDPDGDETPGLPPLAEGQRLDGAFTSRAKQTTPPPRYTEATLLGAMEAAGRAIDDEALRAAMRDRGLGTPATRAAIIETLLRRGYIVRAKQHLAATPLGLALVAALPTPALASPELTGTWEARLARIARGEESRAAFMADIARFVADTVAAIQAAPPPAAPPPGSAPAQRPAWDRKGKRGGRRRGARQYGRRDGNGDVRRDGAAGARRYRGGRRGDAGGGTTTRRDDRTRSALRAGAPNRSDRAAAARVTRTSPPVAAGTAVDLACPACREATLIAGSRGWGCARWREGCRFVIWFETAGRRLSTTQLRDLVTRGKTRKASFEPVRGVPQAGRLVLDLVATAGAARFEPA